MPQFKLIATHEPTGDTTEYGPWDGGDDPIQYQVSLSFAKGFICGVYQVVKGEDFRADQMKWETVELQPVGTVIGQIMATAEGTVTHADGSVG